jgi:hypothetical protein
MQPVLPHGPLVRLDERLWQATGSLARMPLPRNMLVYRLDDGGLLVHSAIALDEPGMQALAALGPVEAVVVPNGFHRLDAKFYRARFPMARFLGPEGSRKRIEQVVHLDDTCEAALPALGVAAHVPDGTRGHEVALELPIAGGVALVFCDLVFNVPHQPGFGGWVLKHVSASTGFFGASRLAKMALVRDKKALAEWLRRMAARDDVRLVAMAHGDAVTDDVPGHLRGAADRL